MKQFFKYVLATVTGIILVAIIMGYREGFASVLTGLFGFMKKDDTDRKLEMKELEVQKAEAENRLTEYAMSNMRAAHDMEVDENVQSAKAYVDEMDMDELVSVGNAMLANDADSNSGGKTK